MRELNKYKKKTSFWWWNLRLKYSLLERMCSRVNKVCTTLKSSSLHVFYLKTAEPLPLAYVTNMQSLLRGQLNRYRYIFDINCLPYSAACITLLIALTKTLPFWFFMSKHCHSNTVNVLCHVSAISFPPVRDFRNSP